MAPHPGFESAVPAHVFGHEVKRDLWYQGATMSTRHRTVLVLHTTEGLTDEGALATFHQRGDPPHWTMDDDSIYQLIPLNRTAAALRHGSTSPPGFSPNECAIQFEIAARSSTSPWKLDAGRLQRLAACMAYSALYLGWSLEHLAYPSSLWKDDKSDIRTIWASNNTRRQWAQVGFRYPDAGPGGVWDHCSVPFQDPTNHYDCGALAIEGQVLPAVRALVQSVLDPPGGGGMAGEADQELEAFYAAGGTLGDVKGNRAFVTGFRFGYRKVALRDGQKAGSLAADFGAGWQAGTKARARDDAQQ